MRYNVGLEVAAIFFTAILYVFLRVQYGGGSRVNQKFRVLTLSVLIANILDVITAITISYGAVVPPMLNLLLNTVYLVMDAMVGYSFVSYIYAYLSPEREQSLGLKINRIILWIYIATFVGNLFAGYYISFDAKGEYQHGMLYPVLFLMPVYYMVFGSVVVWRNRKHFQRKQQISIVIFAALAFGGTVGQAMFCPDILMGLFAVAAGITIMVFSLETPDYQKLMETLEELERTKEEAEREKENAMAADRAKGEFLANMSHELRTPLNSVLGYNGLIMSGTKESHTAEYAANVQSAGRTLLSIISDILDFSVLDEGKLNLHLAPYSTASMLQDVITYAEYHTGKRGLKLQLAIDEALPRQLLGDVVRLTQVINNLVSNAAKYTKKGHVKLQVKWEPKNERCGIMTVGITDTGIGMHKEDIERISECFLRLENEKTRNIPGLGLGLSIVTRLLHLMGGELQIESEYEKGSTFSFSIEQEIMEAMPLGKMRQSKEQDLEECAANTETFFAPQARILAVDDNIMNQDLFVGILKDTGVQVDTAGDGREALELLEKNNYNLIFMDHMMPIMDGISTLHEMRKRGLAQNVPVIVLTANAVAGAREQYSEAGFDEYLSKPIVAKQLVRMVKKYLPEHLIRRADEQELTREEKTLVQRVSFLDTEIAMGYLGDNEVFYEEMLQSYLKNDSRKRIQEYYEKRDWENYCNSVHALKSTSLTIGAVTLSSVARELELAANEGNSVFIEENHAYMMREYRQLLERITEALE